jgi:hypothetical protein
MRKQHGYVRLEGSQGVISKSGGAPAILHIDTSFSPQVMEIGRRADVGAQEGRTSGQCQHGPAGRLVRGRSGDDPDRRTALDRAQRLVGRGLPNV